MKNVEYFLLNHLIKSTIQRKSLNLYFIQWNLRTLSIKELSKMRVCHAVLHSNLFELLNYFLFCCKEFGSIELNFKPNRIPRPKTERNPFLLNGWMDKTLLTIRAKISGLKNNLSQN